MLNPDLAVEILAELSLIGVKISIDDFGTGCSSPGYLEAPSAVKTTDHSHITDTDDVASGALAMAHGKSCESSPRVWKLVNWSFCARSIVTKCRILREPPRAVRESEILLREERLREAHRPRLLENADSRRHRPVVFRRRIVK